MQAPNISGLIATSLTMGSRTIPALYIPAAVVTADSSSLSNTWLVCTPSGSINVGPPSTTLAISTQYMVARLAGYGISSTVSDTSTLMAAVASMGPQLRLGAPGQVLLQEPMSLAAANSSWPATSNTSQLVLANMVVMNTCGITRSLDPNTPNQRTIQAGPILPVTMPSISQPRSPDIPAVVLSNVVLVLPDQELQMHHYWGPLMASSLIAPNFLNNIGSALVLLDNVLITSQLPPGAPTAPAAAPARGMPFHIQPTRDCLTGAVISPSTIADSNLFWINNDAAMTAAMVSITLSTGPTSASRQVGPAGAGQSWSNVTLGLSKLVNMLTIGPSSALHIQGVTLDQLATLDLSTVPGQPSNTGTASIQRHALPLWAFGAS
ncbi:hypothetical protein HaLaN_02682, partial [Haematococcus lacustris]